MTKTSEPENELTEMWREHRQGQQASRAERLPGRQVEILALRDHGFAVRQITDYQFRVEERLDLFPTHRRWHDIRTNTRGRYVDALGIAVKRLAGERV